MMMRIEDGSTNRTHSWSLPLQPQPKQWYHKTSPYDLKVPSLRQSAIHIHDLETVYNISSSQSQPTYPL
jgi:hypothetical protein